MKKLLLVFVICFLTGLAACQDAAARRGPEETLTPTVELTATAVPTETSMPTETPVPTVTPSPVPEILCSAAYLGYVETDYAGFMTFAKDNGLQEQFPVLAEIPEGNTVLASGGEWYLLVPVDETVRFTVCECVLDENTFTLVAGKKLLQLDAGKPLLLCGNVSDIFPSFIVTVAGVDGRTISYAPGLSLRDGALNVVEGVYDFTVYREGQLEE